MVRTDHSLWRSHNTMVETIPPQTMPGPEKYRYSLRIAVSLVVLFVIIVPLFFVVIFLFFVVGNVSSKPVGSNEVIGRNYWMYSAHS
jgi:hypothetical protein